MSDETIAAIATPAGSGAIGIIRVSGPEAISVVARMVAWDPARLVDRQLTRATARDPRTGERLDDVLVAVMRRPRSYTGEDVAELFAHGGARNMARLLGAVTAAGARHAEPGEFTRRAFRAGRIDLTQAEAVLGVIEASSERALRLAQAQLGGEVGGAVRQLRERTVALLAELEAGVDFPEEGLRVEEGIGLAARARELASECQALARTYEATRAIREGISVALVGPVNAGKSSLFNRLVGRERALVAEEPGTTRDFVEAEVEWDGLRVTLIDTAGLREAESEVERRGIDLGARRAAEADITVALAPAGAGSSPAQTGVIGERVLRVRSKGDQLPAGDRAAGASAGELVTSAISGEGLEELRARIVALATSSVTGDGDGAVVTSERQRALLEEAASGLAAAGAAGGSGVPEDVVALDVRGAAGAFARLLGLEPDDAVLDSLFARFCIGK